MYSLEKGTMVGVLPFLVIFAIFALSSFDDPSNAFFEGVDLR